MITTTVLGVLPLIYFMIVIDNEHYSQKKKSKSSSVADPHQQVRLSLDAFLDPTFQFNVDMWIRIRIFTTMRVRIRLLIEVKRICN
jgi:hypothetical protein